MRSRLWEAITPPDVRTGIRALVEHAQLSEPGWNRLGGQAENELDEYERKDALVASYYYWQHDPLMGRAVQLIRDYTFGRGVTWRAADERVKKVVERFWKDKSNRILSRAEGQWELSERLQLAGEVFPIFFVNRFDGTVKMRVIEPEEIEQVVTDPEDYATRLYYLRTWTKREYNWTSKSWGGGETKRDLIPDWDTKPPTYSSVGDDKTYICAHQIKINSHGLRGVPLYFRVIPWVKAYKGFMEDRATLTLAAATFAFKQKIKGAASAVVRMVQQWGNYDAARRYGSGSGKERREGAQTLVENDAVNLEQFNVDTKANNAYQDGRMIRQQVSAGTGITEQNLTGDPSVANLASATQMEGPMLKMFESWQQLWHDAFVDILNFVVDMAIAYGGLPANVDRTIEVDFPPIVSKDLPVVVTAVAALITAQVAAKQTYVSARRLATYILQAFGENDVEKALAEIKFADATPTDTQPLPPAQEQQIQQAIEALRIAVKGLA